MKKETVKKEENIFKDHDDLVFSDDERKSSKCMIPMDDIDKEEFQRESKRSSEKNESKIENPEEPPIS